MKIRPKAFEPEAFKVDIANRTGVIGWVQNRGGKAVYVEDVERDFFRIWHLGSPGDGVRPPVYAYDGQWIVRLKNEFIVLSPDEFRANWEPV